MYSSEGASVCMTPISAHRFQLLAFWDTYVKQWKDCQESICMQGKP